MHTEKCQISNFGSEDFSKEILTDLFRKDVAEFNNMFYHFEYATMEMLAESFNYYLVLKLRIFHQQPHLFCVLQKRLPSMLCNYSGRQTTYFIIETAPKQSRSVSIFFFCNSFFYQAALFPLKVQLKYIINFPYEISSFTIYCYQLSHLILPLFPRIAFNAD